MPRQSNGNRNEPAVQILQLAIDLQSWGGITIQQICEKYGISRRTAERRRDAVGRIFDGLERVRSNEPEFRWRLRSRSLQQLVRVSTQEIDELMTAAATLKLHKRNDLVESLVTLSAKLKAVQADDSRFDSQERLEALLQYEGIAARPGPKEQVKIGFLRTIREAISQRKVIQFKYISRYSDSETHRVVCPYAVLYGSRPYLVGPIRSESPIRLWRISHIDELIVTNDSFEMDTAFDLQSFAANSFGVFQEDPFEVTLSFADFMASEIENWIFHPNQEISYREDGTCVVSFRAGGIDEMLWHFFTWGDLLTIEQPKWLRDAMNAKCASLADHHAQ